MSTGKSATCGTPWETRAFKAASSRASMPWRGLFSASLKQAKSNPSFPFSSAGSWPNRDRFEGSLSTKASGGISARSKHTKISKRGEPDDEASGRNEGILPEIPGTFRVRFRGTFFPGRKRVGQSFLPGEMEPREFGHSGPLRSCTGGERVFRRDRRLSAGDRYPCAPGDPP